MNALAGSPTARRIAAETASEVSEMKEAEGRAGAIIFEKLLVPRLVENSDQISTETTAALVGTDGAPTGLEIRPGTGSTADCFVLWRFANNHTSTVVVNVKKMGASSTNTEVSALSGFVRLATDETYEPENPPTTPIDASREVVAWAARRRKIQRGRDLYLLVADIDEAGKFLDLRAVGSLAAMSKGQPAVRRHRTRDVVAMSTKTTAVLPAGYDINHHIAMRLLPNPTPGQLRAVLLSTLASGCSPEEAVRAASHLLDLSDAEIFEALRAAFTPPTDD